MSRDGCGAGCGSAGRTGNGMYCMAPAVVTDAQVAQFERDGFLIVAGIGVAAEIVDCSVPDAFGSNIK